MEGKGSGSIFLREARKISSREELLFFGTFLYFVFLYFGEFSFLIPEEFLCFVFCGSEN